MACHILYGSTTGRTEAIARRLAGLLGLSPSACHDIAHPLPPEVSEAPCWVLGTATWHHGQQQEDWQTWLNGRSTTVFAGRRCALFGLGDQIGYPDTFQDALGDLYDHVRAADGAVVGDTPVAGYRFRQSRSCRLLDGVPRFVGLALDEETQAARTTARLTSWARSLRHLLDLPRDGEKAV